jgi:hypothetical protein
LRVRVVDHLLQDEHDLGVHASVVHLVQFGNLPPPDGQGMMYLQVYYQKSGYHLERTAAAGSVRGPINPRFDG